MTVKMLTHGSPVRLVVALICLASVFVFVAAETAMAQEYELAGDFELFSAATHFRNAYFVDFGRRNVWLPNAGLRGNFRHRVDTEHGTLLIDHRLTAVNSGFGASIAQTDPSAVALRHDLYHGAWESPITPYIAITAGRHRLPWGIEYTRSVSDSLHPVAAETDARVGFDGLSLKVLPHRNLTLTGAVALQNAIARQNLEYTRAAARADFTYEALDVWASVVSQYLSTLRQGAGVRMRIGPIVYAVETATEYLPPPKSIRREAPLLAVAVETGVQETDWNMVFVGEFRVNSLSDSAPLSAAAVPRMSDNAGGFDLLGREYLFASARIGFRRIYTDQRMLINLTDRSALFDQRFGFAVTPQTEFTFRLVWPWGSSLTEFGTTLDDFVVVAAVKVALPSSTH